MTSQASATIAPQCVASQPVYLPSGDLAEFIRHRTLVSQSKPKNPAMLARLSAACDEAGFKISLEDLPGKIAWAWGKNLPDRSVKHGKPPCRRQNHRPVSVH